MTHRYVVARLLLGLTCFHACLAVASQAAERPVASLPGAACPKRPSHAERSCVGWRMARGDHADDAGKPPAPPWFDGWLGTRLPFSFPYNGHPFSADNTWTFQRGKVDHTATVETQDWSWLHAATGLKVIWHVNRYLDYPAVDTLLTFENAGSKDTPLIEGVENLDLRLNQTQPGREFTIHGTHGGRCGLDDFMPFRKRFARPPARPTRTAADADAAPPRRRKTGDRQVDPQNAADDRRSQIRTWAGHPCHEPDRHPVADADRQVLGLGRRGQQRANSRRRRLHCLFCGDGEEGTVSIAGAPRRRAPPVRVDVAADGATTLYLNVDDAGDGIQCDHADWADAVLTLETGATVRLDESGRLCLPTSCNSARQTRSPATRSCLSSTSRPPRAAAYWSGFGWTGSWQAQFTAPATQLEAQAGMPLTQFRLAPRRKSPRAARAAGRLDGHACTATTCCAACSTSITCPDSRAASRTSRWSRSIPASPITAAAATWRRRPRSRCWRWSRHSSSWARGLCHRRRILRLQELDGSLPRRTTRTQDGFPAACVRLPTPLAKAGVAFGVCGSPDIFGDLGDPQVREKFLAFVDGYVKTQGVTMYRQDGFWCRPAVTAPIGRASPK